MAKSCIVGNGIVGQATAQALGITNFYDNNPARSNMSFQEASACQYIYICLPTPTRENGNQDVDAIESTIAALEETRGINLPIYVMRSTVLPGTSDRFQKKFGMDRFVSNPEFLTEHKWEEDIKAPDLIVVGANNLDYLNEVVDIYKARYKGINIFTCDNKTAELTKYAMNSFFATKVVFANKIYDIAQELGANYETIKNAMYANRNVGKNHLSIWYKGGRGVRGKCLPKDLDAFAHWTNGDFFPFINFLAKTQTEEEEIE